jgi:tight adherence protein B
MLSDPIKILTFIAAGSVFLLVLSLWIGGVLIWTARRKARTRKVERRLSFTDEPTGEMRTLQLWHEGRRVTTSVPVLGGKLTRTQRLEMQCIRAGWEHGLAPMVLLAGGIVVISALFVVVVTRTPLLSVGVAAAMIVLLRIYLQGRISKRDAIFSAQFVDAMELAARSLRAGHPLLGAFQLIAEEMAPPVSDLFGELCQRHEMGASLEESLRDAAWHSPSGDMKLFATSVAIQMRSGGNLADLMDRLAAVIRQRMHLSRRLKTLTAQTQLSKRVLLGLPFVMFIILSVLNPAYMTPFYTTRIGNILITIGVVMLGLGAWAMNKMVKLKY